MSENIENTIDFSGQLNLSPRILLGPGPSNVHPRVLGAIGKPLVGHLDPEFIRTMDQIQDLLRYVWQTKNQLTIPISGTGSAAMEAGLANLIEPQDKVLIAVNGYFGERLVDMAGRYGADVQRLDKTWGQIFSKKEIQQALEKHRPKIFAIVHGETSTGACQPIEEIGPLCHQYNSIFLVDTVTSMGGIPLFIDKWEIDVAYSGSQKCLSCPPGISPLTLGHRALEILDKRISKVPNWYLDLKMVTKYWGNERTYHHTAPINMNYALREALMIVSEEGLESRWERHLTNANLFWEGLKELGLQCHVDKEFRLASLTTVLVPDGVNGLSIQRYLLNNFNIEIAGGLGQLAGKVWRIGLMGYNSRFENIVLILNTLKHALEVNK